MSGERYLLDTNAVVSLLRGNQALHQRLGQAEWVGIPVLSQIEFRAFPSITDRDRQTFQRFLDRVEVVDLLHTESALIDGIVGLRAKYRLRLPDAIIAATAIERNAMLITDDRQLRKLTVVTTSGVP